MRDYRIVKTNWTGGERKKNYKTFFSIRFVMQWVRRIQYYIESTIPSSFSLDDVKSVVAPFAHTPYNWALEKRAIMQPYMGIWRTSVVRGRQIVGTAVIDERRKMHESKCQINDVETCEWNQRIWCAAHGWWIWWQHFGIFFPSSSFSSNFLFSILWMDFGNFRDQNNLLTISQKMNASCVQSKSAWYDEWQREKKISENKFSILPALSQWCESRCNHRFSYYLLFFS